MILNIDEKLQDKVFKEFTTFFNQKLKKKGSLSFNSLGEIFAKLYEEGVIELGHELHVKDTCRFREELLDVAVTALFGVMSIDINKKHS